MNRRAFSERRWLLRAAGCLTALLMLLPALPGAVRAENAPAAPTEDPAAAAAGTGMSADGSGDEAAPGYYDYIKRYGEADRPAVADTAAAYDAPAGRDVEWPVTRGEHDDAVLFTQNGASAQWTVTLPSAGLYALRMRCLLETANAANAKYTVRVNGALPNQRMQSLSFPRVFEDDGAIRADSRGNDIRPSKKELAEWVEFFVCDPGSSADGWMPVYLEAGENRIELEVVVGGVAVTGLTVVQPDAPVSYDEYRALHDGEADNTPAGHLEYFEAEDSLYTSHSELYPTYDRSSASTSPADASRLRLNTIGQSTWNKPGQWIEWEITVPESGYYEIGMRARQNEARGVFSTRRVSLDGEVPFEDLERVRFAYKLSWDIHMLGGEEPYLIYLEKDTPHVLRMEVTYGDLSDSINEMEALTLELNTLYRNIIMITGTSLSVDPYRDYMLDSQIPGLTDSLRDIRRRLEAEMKTLAAMGIRGGSDAVVIEKLIYQIDVFLENPEKIPSGLSAFNDNISSVSAWSQALKSQPLEVDYLFVKSADASAPKAGDNLFVQLWFRLKMLFSSYFSDYSSLAGDGTGEEEITVWVSAGRDQGQIIRDLIDNRFSPAHNAYVELSLMQTGINEAIAAGRNPDVMLFLGDVVNLASREVLADISQYSEFDRIRERFVDTAFVPYTYKGGIYAVPLEQSVLMMFYRKDIFGQLGLEPPETWDEFTTVLTSLQKNRLTAGLSAGSSIAGDSSLFELLVYQNGGRIFNDDLSATTLDSETCYRAFRQWTEYYTRYSLLPEFVFFDRFRSGEMPLGVQGQAMYAQLRLGAPEIDGLWEMTPVPQSVTADGTVSDITMGGFTPAMVFKNDSEELCFRFLDWFTSTDIQVAYGQEVESLLGLGARYNSANREAVSLLNWTPEESALIRSQMESMAITPVVPASYYLGRNLTNAFRKVYTQGYTPREALLMYKDIIDSEITRKNDELARRAGRSKAS